MPHKCLLSFVLVISLALFFGLFFGLNYPEIIRHGWPLSHCTVLSSAILSRYCCETSCDTNSCSNAPSGSPQCGPVISRLDNGYSPSACAANSSACPPDVGSVCDGGSYCCSTCCSTCTSCTTSCSGSGGSSCSTSCSTYSCNCWCCDSASDLYCTISCPICYDVDLGLTYKTRDGALEYANYTQDFGQNNNSASAFYTQHLVNSTSPCHYNPHNFSQVLFNVGFTTWKWVVSSIFGIVPLAMVLGVIIIGYIVIPGFRRAAEEYGDLVASLRKKRFWNKERLAKSPITDDTEEKRTSGEIAPPPYAQNDTKDT